MNLAYVRVSTIEQNEARQIEALQKHHIEKWFTDKVSAKDANRPQLRALLEFAREGDVVYIDDFSRLARSTKDLLDIVGQFEQKGIHLVSNKEAIDTGTPHGRLMLTMIGAIYEFERANLLERQREGIAIQKRLDKGRAPDQRKYKGRKCISIPDFEKHYQRYMCREVSKTKLAEELKISRPTLDKLIKQHRNRSR